MGNHYIFGVLAQADITIASSWLKKKKDHHHIRMHGQQNLKINIAVS